MEATIPALPIAHRVAAAAILCLLAGHTAGAADFVRADLKISDPWARASRSKTAEAFLTIRNGGKDPDRLMAISSPIAKRVELQRYEAIGGVNSAQRIKSIEIPAGQTLALAPATTVLSLVGLKRPLIAGATVTLTLTFARAGAVSVFAKVADADATAAPPPPKPKEDPGKAPNRKPRRR